MKCIMRPIHTDNGTPDVEVYRVSDAQARRLVQTGVWSYTGKELWKQRGRKYFSKRRMKRYDQEIIETK